VEPAAGFLSVDLIGVNGVQSVNDTRYPIRWVMDQSPVVTLSVAPTDGETVAAGRSIRIAGGVSEDYTLETLQFCYEIHQADAEDAIMTNSMPVSFAADTLLFDLNVSIGGAAPPNGVTVDAPLGGSIQWWFEAIDNCALSDGPHVTQTERVTLAVISVDEKIAELMGRVRDEMSTIEQVGDRQSEASERLGELTRSHISNNDE
jgi:hypothetical protein